VLFVDSKHVSSFPFFSGVDGQAVDCRGAIRTYAMAARVRQTASLVYLDAHRRTALTRIAGDIAGEPYATLKTMTDGAKARAVAICG